ncbi:hypothetical protein [Burkholderia ubonensis]|uniref:hypothetical protein n=1 Tax=Burkholderia ubonensis TaxID=101571 RepID=UPI002AAF1E1E|nr:hypothetical protein [Burkholderia ubonensis]
MATARFARLSREAGRFCFWGGQRRAERAADSCVDGADDDYIVEQRRNRIAASCRFLALHAGKYPQAHRNLFVVLNFEIITLIFNPFVPFIASRHRRLDWHGFALSQTILLI